MPRTPRLHVPGTLCHVIARGIVGQTLFADAEDYRRFIGSMVRAAGRSDSTVLCYVLMPDHVHLLVESGRKPLSHFMQPLLTAYSVYFNRRNRREGHVFRGRYKAVLCERELYERELIRYLHLNPVRAGLVGVPEKWSWSSHAEILGTAHHGVLSPVTVQRVLTEVFGGLQEYLRFMDDRSAPRRYRADLHPAGTTVLLGSDGFIRRMAAQRPMEGCPRPTDAQIRALAAAIARESGVSITMLRGALRTRTVTQARRRFIAAALRTLGCSQSRIAAVLGCDQSYISRVAAECLRGTSGGGGFS